MSEWVDVSCPICGSDTREQFVVLRPTERSEGHKIQWWMCECGMLYLSPCRQNLTEHYRNGYRTAIYGQEAPTERDIKIQRMRADYLVALLRDNIPLSDIATHLDIGCSTGALMERIRYDYHCETTGVELTEAHVAYCRERGLTVLQEYPHGEEFDLVTMIHALEHLPHPVEYLKNIRSTWLLVEVPNAEADPAAFLPDHTVAFYVNILARTIRQAGFDVVLSWKHPMPWYTPILRSITVLAKRHE